MTGGSLSVRNSKWGSLTVLAVCQVAAMSLWFSASAVIPSLVAEYGISGLTQALFTSAVQAGFVVGSLVSAVLGLADRWEPRRFFAAAAIIAAGANGAILLVDPTSPAVVLLRFVTGICMVGIYPVGMKLASTWARGDMGLLVGLLVGALTLGSASPHLFNAMGGAVGDPGGSIDWRFTLGLASVAALAAGLLIPFCGVGPVIAPQRRFDPKAVLWAWKDKALRYANFGYFGHMWELYAVWAWIGVFLHASFALRLDPETALHGAKLVTFATVGIGALGALGGGLFADRYGRTTLTMLSLGISGLCCVLAGLLFGANPWVLTALCLVWGFAVVADSAQFSASVAELSNRDMVGTMLTLQTALGFTLTLITIHLMPVFVDWLGWRYAFMPLALGPAFGVWAMAKLRAHPDAVKLAGGKR